MKEERIDSEEIGMFRSFNPTSVWVELAVHGDPVKCYLFYTT